MKEEKKTQETMPRSPILHPGDCGSSVKSTSLGKEINKSSLQFDESVKQQQEVILHIVYCGNAKEPTVFCFRLNKKFLAKMNAPNRDNYFYTSYSFRHHC